MASLDVIRTMTLKSKTEGVEQTTQQLNQLAGAQDKVTTSATQQEKATRSVDAAVVMLVRSFNQELRAQDMIAQAQRTIDQTRQQSASGLQAANDNMAGFSKTLVDNTASVVTNIAHLKLLATAAYALSPAFRSFVNAGVVASFAQLGGVMGPLATAAQKTLSVLSPALSLFARLTIPIGLLVGAWELLNSVVKRGSDLLSQYGDAQRKFFSGDVEQNLAQLTKFQQDTIPIDQVQRATELGARLQIAKDKLAEFAKVQLDLTEPALKLQAAWVAIVETIAKGVGLLSGSLDKLTSFAQAFGNLPVWKLLASGGDQSAIIARINAQNSTAQQLQETMEQQRARGLGLLGAAMSGGTSFGERFSAAIKELADPSKVAAVKQLAGEFDRLADSIARSTAAVEADAKTEGKAAGEVARLRTEFRLLEAAQQDILKHGGDIDAYAARIKALADRAGEAAQALAKARIASDIKFERALIPLSAEDVAIAQKLRNLYGDDIPAALASAEASALRFNNALRDVKDTAAEFAKGFVQAMLQGKSATEALQGSLGSLSQKFADKSIDKLLGGDFIGAGSSAVVSAGAAVRHGVFGGPSAEETKQQPQQPEPEPKECNVRDQYRSSKKSRDDGDRWCQLVAA